MRHGRSRVGRRIGGFHADDEEDWAAVLARDHRHHVRHRPPFRIRRWVLDPEGRAGRIGTCSSCPLCELAERLVEVGRRGPWSAAESPLASRQAHQTPGGRWSLLRVLAGRATVAFLVAQGEGRHQASRSRRLRRPGEEQPLPPGRWHQVDPEDGAELELVLLAGSPASAGGDDG